MITIEPYPLQKKSHIHSIPQIFQDSGTLHHHQHDCKAITVCTFRTFCARVFSAHMYAFSRFLATGE